MADKKISQLTELPGNEIDYQNDFIPIVDASASETKKFNLAGALINTPSDVNLSYGGEITAGSLNINSNSFKVDTSTDGAHFIQASCLGTGQFFSGSTTSLATRFTLGCNSEGKIIEDQAVKTFRITGSGFLYLNTKPKVLIPAPGPGKFLLPFEIFVYQEYKVRAGFGGLPSNQPAYAIGTTANTEPYDIGFQQLWGLHLTPAQTTSDIIAYRAVPITPSKHVLENRPLVLRQGLNQQTAMGTDVNGAAVPGGAHNISIRYMVLDATQDFTDFPGLHTINYTGHDSSDT
jgi:hypothetical protein